MHVFWEPDGGSGCELLFECHKMHVYFYAITRPKSQLAYISVLISIKMRYLVLSITPEGDTLGCRENRLLAMFQKKRLAAWIGPMDLLLLRDPFLQQISYYGLLGERLIAIKYPSNPGS